MNKINNLIENNIVVHSASLLEDIERIMKAYAEHYAKKCLEIAAKEASANYECIGAVLGAENVVPYVEESSILNIKLPEHD